MTVRALTGLAEGQVISESLGRGVGSLRAVGQAERRVGFYFRHTRSNGQRDDLPVGFWSECGGDGGFTLFEARQRVRLLAARYAAGERDLRLAMELERRETQRQFDEAERARLAEVRRAGATLGALLEAYAGSLREDGKASARAVENSLRLHVQRRFPTLWALPVDEVGRDDLVRIVHRLVAAGKTVEARKIRSYLRAAFSAAMAAAGNPSASASLRDLRIAVNPARDVMPVKGGVRARDRALSVGELRHYWARIAEGRDQAILRFHLLTGAQRVEQLARATDADWDRESQTLRLMDPKGRRQSPRAHYVPLLAPALDALHDMQAGTLGPFLFTVTAGVSGACYTGVSKRLDRVTMAMASAGELDGPRFTLGDLRRTVETRLAAAKVSAEVRAHLQSHGLSGVQARHYVRHDFLEEKRDALRCLTDLFLGDAPVIA